MNLKQMQRDAAALVRDPVRLPQQEIYYLLSLDNPDKDVAAGRVFEVSSRERAADFIVGRTHILAPLEAIAAFKAAQAQAFQDLAKSEYERKQQFALPREMQDVMRVAAESIKARNEETSAPARPERKNKEQ